MRVNPRITASFWSEVNDSAFATAAFWDSVLWWIFAISDFWSSLWSSPVKSSLRAGFAAARAPGQNLGLRLRRTVRIAGGSCRPLPHKQKHQSSRTGQYLCRSDFAHGQLFLYVRLALLKHLG